MITRRVIIVLALCLLTACVATALRDDDYLQFIFLMAAPVVIFAVAILPTEKTGAKLCEFAREAPLEAGVGCLVVLVALVLSS
jgi:hypothetical protein